MIDFEVKISWVIIGRVGLEGIGNGLVGSNLAQKIAGLSKTELTIGQWNTMDAQDDETLSDCK